MHAEEPRGPTQRTFRRREKKGAGKQSRDSWLSACLEVLAEDGLSAVAVEPLARRLGVTKGSFYWHFSSRDELLRAALEYWERDQTLKCTEQLDRIASPQKRLRELFSIALRHFESGRIISRLAGCGDDPRVAPTMRRVTNERVRFIEKAYREMGLPDGDARTWALRAYSEFLGIHSLLQSGMAIRPREVDEFVAHVLDLLIPKDLPAS